MSTQKMSPQNRVNHKQNKKTQWSRLGPSGKESVPQWQPEAMGLGCRQMPLTSSLSFKPDNILFLQRTTGNRAVQQRLSSLLIQRDVADVERELGRQPRISISRLTEALESVEAQTEAAALLQRLETRAPGDILAERFHSRLGPGNQLQMRQILELAAAEWEEEDEATESRFLELPGEPLTGSSGPTQLRTVESAGETFAVGDVSGSWQIVGIERDYQGVVTVRARNRTTRQTRGFSLQDWHVQLSIAHVQRSTEAMAAIAEAEVQILYELALPAWIRVPAEIAWVGFVMHRHRQELENLIEQMSQLNPALDWLQQHSPTSVQVFLVRTAALAADRRIPDPMNPVEVGREIGSALRNLRTLMHLIVAITRVARGSVAGAFSSSLRVFTSVGRAVAQPGLANILSVLESFHGLRSLWQMPAHIDSTIRQEVRGQVAEWAREQGITLNNPMIDSLIRENVGEETGEKIIEVVNSIRNFLRIANALADEIDHQRPSSAGPAQ